MEGLLGMDVMHALEVVLNMQTGELECKTQQQNLYLLKAFSIPRRT